MDTSSVFSRGIEIRMSLLPRSDPPSFALFSLAHKSLSLDLSETYFPVETAFLNSIRSYWRANRRGTRARRESKKSPHVPRKADRCPVTALSLLDSWIFTKSACARGHVYIFISRRFSPPGISPRREVFACAREREHDVYAFRVHGRLNPVDVERRRTELGISWITYVNNIRDRDQPTTLYNDTADSRIDGRHLRRVVRDRSILSTTIARCLIIYLWLLLHNNLYTPSIPIVHQVGL